eukprot:CAMPEP_0174937344 /NCGR_PEP_ID=MMETSP1355-20121228/60210_1 /TAXON_ID=464990 /ORGANISM="Hemiselmis tepida, Strain CCMP443" /LENGTH=556 /DNA_ID=CAMNT_0016184189 /DNA_START=98 /DNA_END=1764 /DNA_ORIENTATION=-
MSLEAQDYLPMSRTIRYRTEDPIQNLRIKLVMRSQEGNDTESRWIMKERHFAWQEKVFGPTEFDKYKTLAAEIASGKVKKKGLTPLEERYAQQIEHVAAGEAMFTYVDADSFEDVTEFVSNVTTSPFEKPTPLAERMMKVQEKRGRHTELSEPFKMMYIVAQVKGRVDVTVRSEEGEGPTYIMQEEVLCAIRVYSDGTIDMTPGFSPKPPIKVDPMKGGAYKTTSEQGVPYRLETESGCVYEYWLENATEPADASEVAAAHAKEVRFQQELFDKTQELRRNFVGDEFEPYSDQPELDARKVMINCEIVSAQGFDWDHVYVQYLIDVPEGWATGDAPQLWGNSQVSRVRHKRDERGKADLEAVANFSMPVELTLWECAKDEQAKGKENREGEGKEGKGGARRVPCMLLQVNSYDQWDRQRVLGYGHMNLPLSPGFTDQAVMTWRPALSQVGKMRSFFIGGTPELRDLTFAGLPTGLQGPLSRYGFSSESSGSVRVRSHCVVQGPKPPQPKDGRHAREALKSSAQAVADATHSGRQGREATLVRARKQRDEEKMAEKR